MDALRKRPQRLVLRDPCDVWEGRGRVPRRGDGEREVGSERRGGGQEGFREELAWWRAAPGTVAWLLSGPCGRMRRVLGAPSCISGSPQGRVGPRVTCSPEDFELGPWEFVFPQPLWDPRRVCSKVRKRFAFHGNHHHPGDGLARPPDCAMGSAWLSVPDRCAEQSQGWGRPTQSPGLPVTACHGQ